MAGLFKCILLMLAMLIPGNILIQVIRGPKHYKGEGSLYSKHWPGSKQELGAGFRVLAGTISVAMLAWLVAEFLESIGQ